jgi:hypothetical protein
MVTTKKFVIVVVGQNTCVVFNPMKYWESASNFAGKMLGGDGGAKTSDGLKDTESANNKDIGQQQMRANVKRLR